MDQTARALIAVVGSILTLALISTVLSPKANTAGVIQASSAGLSGLISAATAPVTGSGGGSSGGLGGGNLLNSFSSVLSGLGGSLP